MKSILFSVLLLATSAFAEKEVKTCVFDSSSSYFADSKIVCMEPNTADNMTIKTLYKDGWELKTSYFPYMIGGANYGTTKVDVVLVFERDKNKKK